MQRIAQRLDDLGLILVAIILGFAGLIIDSRPVELAAVAVLVLGGIRATS